MTFLNPALLWGILAVAVPIALHFWHQQQAKPMPWAMLRWLETPNQPPKRGFRFDNWLLLALRCLLLTTLALLLARPDFPDRNTGITTKAVHLVEPNSQLVAAYRFELEQAQQRDEPLYWATIPLLPVTLLSEPPQLQPLNPLLLQAAIDQATAPQARLHVYLRNTANWTDSPAIRVPASFALHTLPSAEKAPSASLALTDGNRLTVNSTGRLVVETTTPAATSPVVTAPLRVLIQFTNPTERATVRAALGALTEVYKLTYLVDEQPVANQPYTWILTDKPLSDPKPGTIYTLTSQPIRPDWPNVHYLPGPLTPTNDDVANGQLPEQLGAHLAEGLGLWRNTNPLSRPAFAALFTHDQAALADVLPTAHPRNVLQSGLLVVFLSLILVERWLAIRRGA